MCLKYQLKYQIIKIYQDILLKKSHLWILRWHSWAEVWNKDSAEYFSGHFINVSMNPKARQLGSGWLWQDNLQEKVEQLQRIVCTLEAVLETVVEGDLDNVVDWSRACNDHVWLILRMWNDYTFAACPECDLDLVVIK